MVVGCVDEYVWVGEGGLVVILWNWGEQQEEWGRRASGGEGERLMEAVAAAAVEHFHT